VRCGRVPSSAIFIPSVDRGPLLPRAADSEVRGGCANGIISYMAEIYCQMQNICRTECPRAYSMMANVECRGWWVSERVVVPISSPHTSTYGNLNKLCGIADPPDRRLRLPHIFRSPCLIFSKNYGSVQRQLTQAYSNCTCDQYRLGAITIELQQTL
jgi:hypothetical protein